MPPKNILMVDDHVWFRRSLQRVFAATGWPQVTELDTQAPVVEQVAHLHPTLIFYSVADQTGIHRIAQLHQIFP